MRLSRHASTRREYWSTTAATYHHRRATATSVDRPSKSHPGAWRGGAARDSETARTTGARRSSGGNSGDPRAPACCPHQPLDAAPADAVPAPLQRSVDPRAAVGAVALLDDRTHLLERRPILPLTRTHRPPTPRVVPGARDPEEPAEPHHAERFFLGDEREDVGLRAEVNRMSLVRSACSSFSSAWARRRAWYRRISDGGAAFKRFGTDLEPRSRPRAPPFASARA